VPTSLSVLLTTSHRLVCPFNNLVAIELAIGQQAAVIFQYRHTTPSLAFIQSNLGASLVILA